MADVAEGEEGGTKTNAAPSTNQSKMKEDEITTRRCL